MTSSMKKQYNSTEQLCGLQSKLHAAKYDMLYCLFQPFPVAMTSSAAYTAGDVIIPAGESQCFPVTSAWACVCENMHESEANVAV